MYVCIVCLSLFVYVCVCCVCMCMCVHVHLQDQVIRFHVLFWGSQPVHPGFPGCPVPGTSPQVAQDLQQSTCSFSSIQHLCIKIRLVLMFGTLPQPREDTKDSSRAIYLSLSVMGRTVLHQSSCASALPSRSSERDCIWRQGLYRGDSVSMSSLG